MLGKASENSGLGEIVAQDEADITTEYNNIFSQSITTYSKTNNDYVIIDCLYINWLEKQLMIRWTKYESQDEWQIIFCTCCSIHI